MDERDEYEDLVEWKRGGKSYKERIIELYEYLIWTIKDVILSKGNQSEADRLEEILLFIEGDGEEIETLKELEKREQNPKE